VTVPVLFRSVIDQFIDSPQFAKLSDSTAAGWKRELLLIARPEFLGTQRAESIRPSKVQMYLDLLVDRPGKQSLARAALRALESWAIVRELLAFPITTGVQIEGGGGGHAPWSDAQVELAESYATPLMSRAITLGANTGQRTCDLIRMGWGDLEFYGGRFGINVTQQKTKLRLWVPCTKALEAAIATWEKRPAPFVSDEQVNPSKMARSYLATRWGWEREHILELAPLRGMTLHGLRATAVVRLRREGAEPTQITDFVGMSEQMVRRYCRHSDQRDNAIAAVEHLDRRAQERAKNTNATRAGISDKK
jgi:integrase